MAKQPVGRNAFIFVVFTVFLDMVGYALIVPVLPFLLADLLDAPMADVVPWAGYVSGTFAVANLLAQPILGGLSDRFGRRPVLLASMAMLSVDFLIMGLSGHIATLFVGRALSGLAAATHSTAAAYIADVTEPADRGRAFGMMGAAFGLGFILGPALGGILGDIHPRAPFFAAAALAALNFCYGLFVLPESLAPELRRPFDLRRANPFGALRHFAARPEILWFMVALGIYNLGHWVFPATWAWHGQIRYGWTMRDIGLSLTVVGLASAVFQGGLVGPLGRRLGPAGSVLVGGSAAVVALVGYALASSPFWVWWFVPVGAFAGLIGPSLQQVMSVRVSPSAQGELQGALASVQATTNIVGPWLFTQCLHHFARPDATFHAPGAPFALAAILTVLAAVPYLIGLKQPVPPHPG